MKKFMSKNRFILWLCVVFIIILLGLIVIMFYSQRRVLVDANNKNLQILADEKASQINLFLESEKEKLGIISSMNVIKEAIKYPNDTAKIEMAKNRINELKGIISGISVLTSEGIVVIGDVDFPGTDYSQYPYFIDKRQDTTFTIYYDPLRKKDYYAIIGPIYDKSKIIGRIAFDIELEKISYLMKETVESETNEVYLIDETGLLLSGSEYIDENNKNGVLIQEVKSDCAKACLKDLNKYKKTDVIKKHEEIVSQYSNYMGNEVFGAYTSVPSIMGCVIAEKGADKFTEYSLIDNIKNIFIKKVIKDEN